MVQVRLSTGKKVRNCFEEAVSPMGATPICAPEEYTEYTEVPAPLSSGAMNSAATPDPRRYLVLGCFCFHSFIQCFDFMDFSTDADLSHEALGESAPLLNGLLYYGGFAATLPAMFISLYLLLRGHDWLAGFAMSMLIVAGAWLRLAAVHFTSYTLALVSTIALGAAGGVIFTSFTFVPERWFPQSERPFATALAVQSNYAGWALGCLNPTMLGKKHVSDLKTFLLWLAIVTSFALPFHFLANTRGPRGGEASHGSGGGSLSFVATLKLLVGRPQYLIHSMCYAVLGAVGYAVTGVVDSCFSAALPMTYDNSTGKMVEDGFDNEQTMGLNVIFVVTGVISGLVVGRVVPDSPMPQAYAVRSLFLLAASALLGVQLLILNAAEFEKKTLYQLLLLLMCLAGAGTLGFIGVGLRVAVGYSHPAQEIYSGSIIEFLLLAIASSLGLLTYVVPPSATFWFFALPACAATVVIFTCARFQHDEAPLLEITPEETSAAYMHSTSTKRT